LDMRNSVVLIATVILYTLGGLTSCSEEEVVEPEVKREEGIESVVPVDSGSIGLVVDTRPVARMGYQPVRATITFSGNFSSYSDEIEIDPSTNVGVFRLIYEDVPKAVREAFAGGVPLNIKVFNEQGTELSSADFDRQEVDASNNPVSVETDLPEILPPVSLSPGTPYILYSEASGKVMTTVPVPALLFPPYPRGVTTSDYNPEGDIYQEFYFEKGDDDDSEYFLLGSGGYIISGNTLNQSTIQYDPGEMTHLEKIVIEVDGGGWVKLKSLSGNYYTENTDPNNLAARDYAFNVSTEGHYTRFRIINADIQWTLINRGIKFNQPVLPPARLDFAYSATLSNCSSATLTETVGRNETRSQTHTSGFEESLQLFSSHTAYVEVSAGVEVDATFFGKGATYNFQVTAGYEYTTAETSTKTNYWQESTTTEIETSRTRTVQLVANSAVEVYDAVQSLDNVKVAFTKEFRLEGVDSDGEKIKGSELEFQLFTSQFEGIVTETGPDYIDFTVRGTTSVDRMLEVETRVSEIDGACN
jgi:hypothetical protein